MVAGRVSTSISVLWARSSTGVVVIRGDLALGEDWTREMSSQLIPLHV